MRQKLWVSIALQCLQPVEFDQMREETIFEGRAFARELAYPVLGRRCLDHPLVKILIGKHDVCDNIGVPLGFAVLFDPCFRKDVMDVAAGGFA